MLALIVCCSATSVNAQTSTEDAYVKTITQRSNKIIAALGLVDSSVFYNIQTLLVQQYSFLNTTHNTFKEKQLIIKKDTLTPKQDKELSLKNIEIERDNLLKNQHAVFLINLSKSLNSSQVEQIKDGITYGVLPITFKGYQEMLPNLTAEQKDKIYTYLLEARELAMDAESSEKKHAMFGKYKGRINNYLSAEGIDMKKAGKEWEEKIKAAKNK